MSKINKSEMGIKYKHAPPKVTYEDLKHLFNFCQKFKVPPPRLVLFSKKLVCRENQGPREDEGFTIKDGKLLWYGILVHLDGDEPCLKCPYSALEARCGLLN